MKKLLSLTLLVFLFSCSVNTSGNIDLDPEDIKYFKDERTELCYAITASRKTANLNTTGIAMTCVPCDNVEHLIN